MIISIDVGYSQVKAVSENSNKVLFPSVKATMVNDPLGGILKNGIGHKVRIRNLNNEQTFLVGEAARQSLTATATLSREKSAELHDLFILTAAYLCGANGFTNLAVGLPLAFYRFQKDELRARLEKISGHITVDNGPERYISISGVNVFPQGVGVLISSEIDVSEGLVSVIDIGYYTTDFLLCEVVNGSYKPLPEFCGSIDSGVHLVSRALEIAYQEKTGSLAPKTILDSLITGKPVYFNGKQYDFATEFEMARQYTAEQILQEVTAAWGKQSEAIYQNVLAGGGSLLLKDYLKLTNKVIPADPVFANANGFLSLITD